MNLNLDDTLRALLAERYATTERPARPRPLTENEVARRRRLAGEALNHARQDYRRGRRAA